MHIGKLTTAVAILLFPTLSHSEPITSGASDALRGIERGPQREQPLAPSPSELRKKEPPAPLAVPDQPANPPQIQPTQQSLEVTSIIINGGTVFKKEELEAMVRPFTGRRVSVQELQLLRYNISKAYLDKGHINSGAVLPQYQPRLREGIITYQIIEGDLTRVSLSGNDRLRNDYVTSRITDRTNKPLNVYQLQETLRQLQLNPRISRLQAQLLPGDKLGTSVLDLKIEEAIPYDLTLSFDNHRAPSVGEENLNLSFNHRNVTGWGDELTLSTGTSDGADDYYLRYAFPLTGKDMMLGMSYSQSDSAIVEEPADELDLESESDSASIFFNQPIINTLSKRWAWSVSLDKRTSTSTLAGQKLDLSAGPIDGESATTGLSLTNEWIKRAERSVFAWRATVRQGLDLMGATVNDDRDPGCNIVEDFFCNTSIKNDDLPDGEFTTLVNQLQYAYLVESSAVEWLGGEFQARNTIQWASEPLLSIEKFAVGGAYTVRGYRENQFVRDNGYLFNIEYHIPLFRNAVGQSRYGLKLVPFIDHGTAWDHSDVTKFGGDDEKQTISSVGVGLTWDKYRWLHAELFYGEALDDGDIPEPEEKTLQDDGLHFALSVSWPFE